MPDQVHPGAHGHPPPYRGSPVRFLGQGECVTGWGCGLQGSRWCDPPASSVGDRRGGESRGSRHTQCLIQVESVHVGKVRHAGHRLKKPEPGNRTILEDNVNEPGRAESGVRQSSSMGSRSLLLPITVQTITKGDINAALGCACVCITRLKIVLSVNREISLLFTLIGAPQNSGCGSNGMSRISEP